MLSMTCSSRHDIVSMTRSTCFHYMMHMQYCACHLVRRGRGGSRSHYLRGFQYGILKVNITKVISNTKFESVFLHLQKLSFAFHCTGPCAKKCFLAQKKCFPKNVTGKVYSKLTLEYRPMLKDSILSKNAKLNDFHEFLMGLHDRDSVNTQ